MLQLVHSVTLTEANGRLWPDPPAKPGVHGLVTVLQTPSSHVSASVRSLAFSAVALDARGDHAAAVTTRGDVYVFHLKQNR